MIFLDLFHNRLKLKVKMLVLRRGKMLEWVDGVYLFSYSLSRVLAFIQFFFSSCRKGKDYANAKRDGISLTRRHLPRSLVYHLSSRDRRVINRNSWNTEFSRLQFTTCNTLHF